MAKNYYVESGFKKALLSDIIAACENACKEQGGKVKDIQKNLEVYVKPEEAKAYYVLKEANITGSVDIVFA